MAHNFFPERPDFGDAARKIVALISHDPEQWAILAPWGNETRPSDPGGADWAAPRYAVVQTFDSEEAAQSDWRRQARVKPGA